MNKITKTQSNDQKSSNDLSQLWLPTSAIAKLIGKSEQSIRKSCDKANGSYRGGVYIFRKKGRNYEILLSSIPNNAQNEYRIQQLDALKNQSESAPPVKLSTALITTSDSEFAYYDALFND